MSTSISAFSQAKTTVVSAFENNAARTVSSVGPKALLRLRSDAGTFSKSGASISLRGIGAKSLLHDLKIVQPLQVRFKKPGTEGAGSVVIPNQFMSGYSAPALQEANQDAENKASTVGTVGLAGTSLFNCVKLRTAGWAHACSSIVLSINGTSWQCRPKSFLKSFDKIFTEGRYDSCTAQKTPCPPYSNAYSSTSIMNQPGVKDNCLSMMQDVEIVSVSSQAADGQRLTDIVYHVNLVSRIPIGPFLMEYAPALSTLNDSELTSLPFIRDLSVEFTYGQSPLSDFFVTCSTDSRDSLAVDCGDNIGAAKTLNSLTDGGFDGGIDFDGMWDSCVVGEELTPASLAQNKYCSIMRPYLLYTLVEPDPKRFVQRDLITVPSCSFVTYNQDCQISAGKEFGTVNWEYIQVDTMPQLICLSVFESDRDAGSAKGPRGPRFVRGNSIDGHRGEQAHDICAPLKYESLKISMTIANQVLGNFDGSDRKASTTYFDMWRTWCKYTKNKQSFSDWYRYNRCLVFSPQELCGTMPSLTSAPISLNISVEFARTASETQYCPRDLLVTTAGDSRRIATTKNGYKRGMEKAQNFDCSLWFLMPEAVQLSPGQCGVTRVSFSPSEVEQAWTGDAERQLESSVIGQFVQ